MAPDCIGEGRVSGILPWEGCLTPNREAYFALNGSEWLNTDWDRPDIERGESIIRGEAEHSMTGQSEGSIVPVHPHHM